MAAGPLELKGIGKHFGALAALRDINLQVGADELLVVLGPTGAGKTTLLRTVAVLSEGRILQVGRPETVYRKLCRRWWRGNWGRLPSTC